MKFVFLMLFTFNILASDNGLNSGDTKDFWENEKPNMLSPITTPAAWVLGIGSILTYAQFRDAKSRDKVGYNPDHSVEVSGDWRYWGHIVGWGLFQLAYTATQLPGINEGDKKALENTEIMWKSTIYTAMSTLALKLSVRAQRPNSDTKYDSFPSGHASAAFAFATNVALRHEWYWNFVSIPLTLWATTARISDDSHHVHDSIFGAALGMSFALGMNYLAGDVPFLLGFEPMEEGGSVTFNFNF